MKASPNDKGAVALRVFMSATDLSVKELAARLSAMGEEGGSSVTPQTVTRWRRGNLRPSRDHAALLDELSGGAVPASVWLRVQRADVAA